MKEERLLSRREHSKLKKLLAEYHKLGDEIYRCKTRRAYLADEIVQLICPFQIGDRVCPPAPTRFSTEPPGVYEVIEVVAARHAYDIDDGQNRPAYQFQVRRVLKNGSLGKQVYTIRGIHFWRKVT